MPRRVALAVMCHYCGCREMPLLRDYIAEHERAINFGGEAVRAIDRGDLTRARHLLVRWRPNWPRTGRVKRPDCST